MARLQPFFHKSHGKPRVDDRRVLSGIIFLNSNWLRRRDAPKEYGLAAKAAVPKTVMIDATDLKAHRTATSLWSKRGTRRPERSPDRPNKGRHEHEAACRHRCRWSSDPVLHNGRMTAGQVSDYTGAAALLDGLPKAEWLLADRGYDADCFREALKYKGIKPCIPGRKTRGKPVKHDRRRNRIVIVFGRLKDRRRVATRYDRCPKVFLSAVTLAATVMFW